MNHYCFCLLKIYKNLGFLLSAVTLVVNSSHADNHSHKYINFFQTLYSLKSVFSLNTGYVLTKFFIFKFDLNVNHPKAVVRGCSLKKVFLEISQNSQENTCARDSFLIKLQADLQFY